jgi:hypothetical protein
MLFKRDKFPQTHEVPVLDLISNLSGLQALVGKLPAALMVC